MLSKLSPAAFVAFGEGFEGWLLYDLLRSFAISGLEARLL